MPSATVLVRYWAAARAAAGVDSERLTGDTVGAVLGEAVARHTGLAPVLRVASVLVDGRAVDREQLEVTPITDGAVVEVLPPFAGG